MLSSTQPADISTEPYLCQQRFLHQGLHANFAEKVQNSFNCVELLLAAVQKMRSLAATMQQQTDATQKPVSTATAQHHISASKGKGLVAVRNCREGQNWAEFEQRPNV